MVTRAFNYKALEGTVPVRAPALQNLKLTERPSRPTHVGVAQNLCYDDRLLRERQGTPSVALTKKVKKPTVC
jgi:hypothetical protein